MRVRLYPHRLVSASPTSLSRLAFDALLDRFEPKGWSVTYAPRYVYVTGPQDATRFQYRERTVCKQLRSRSQGWVTVATYTHRNIVDAWGAK